MSQSRPAPPALIAEATKRAGLIWITIGGQDRPRPAWHVWRPGTGPVGPGALGAAYVVTGPGEQPLPGLDGAGRVTVIVPGGQTAGGRVEWTAAVGRVEPGSGEWDEVIGPLVAGRLNAVLADGEASPARRWATSGAVFRLAPVLDDAAPGDRGPDDTAAPNSRILLSAAPLSVHPDRRLAGRRAADRHLILRQPGRLAGRHVQLGPPQLRSLPAEPGHGRARPLTTGCGRDRRDGFLPHRQDQAPIHVA